MQFLFEKLDVYVLALKFHKEIITLCQSGSLQDNYHVVDNLKKASLFMVK